MPPINQVWIRNIEVVAEDDDVPIDAREIDLPTPASEQQIQAALPDSCDARLDGRQRTYPAYRH